MPPKGYKKGYVKHPETGEYVDPRTLEDTTPKKISIEKKQKPKSTDSSPMQSVPDDRDHVKVIISWKDAKGRMRTTQYVMATLTINEDVQEVFTGAKKTTHLRLSLDGTVLEKQ